MWLASTSHGTRPSTTKTKGYFHHINGSRRILNHLHRHRGDHLSPTALLLADLLTLTHGTSHYLSRFFSNFHRNPNLNGSQGPPDETRQQPPAQQAPLPRANQSTGTPSHPLPVNPDITPRPLSTSGNWTVEELYDLYQSLHDRFARLRDPRFPVVSSPTPVESRLPNSDFRVLGSAAGGDGVTARDPTSVAQSRGRNTTRPRTKQTSEIAQTSSDLWRSGGLNLPFRGYSPENHRRPGDFNLPIERLFTGKPPEAHTTPRKPRQSPTTYSNLQAYQAHPEGRFSRSIRVLAEPSKATNHRKHLDHRKLRTPIALPRANAPIFLR